MIDNVFNFIEYCLMRNCGVGSGYSKGKIRDVALHNNTVCGVSHPPSKQLIIRYKKGVRIVSCFTPLSGLGLPSA